MDKPTVQVDTKKETVRTGKITVTNNYANFRAAVAGLKGKIDPTALLKDANDAIKLLDDDPSFGSPSDWMIFLNALKTFSIGDINEIEKLHKANVAKNSVRGSKISKQKNEEKFQVFCRANLIILNGFGGDRRALTASSFYQTDIVKNLTQTWVQDFGVAFPLNKADLYSKLAFSVIDYDSMRVLIMPRILIWTKFLTKALEMQWIEPKGVNSSYMGKLMTSKCWVIKEAKLTEVKNSLNVPGSQEAIEAGKEAVANHGIGETLEDGMKNWQFTTLLAGGIVDVRKLKQSGGFKKSNEKQKLILDIGGLMLGFIQFVDGVESVSKWTAQDVDLSVGSAFTKAYYSAFQSLQITAGNITGRLFPRSGETGGPMLVAGSELRSRITDFGTMATVTPLKAVQL